MSRAGYGRRWCYVCGTERSTSGWHFHARKHVREGKMIERRVWDKDGYYHYEFDIVKGTPLISQKKRTHNDEPLES